jgi:hypothetical protein
MANSIHGAFPTIRHLAGGRVVERWDLLPPAARGSGASCVLQRLAFPEGERWGLSLPGHVEVRLRRHGHTNTGAFDDRAMRAPVGSFFLVDESLLIRAAGAGTLAALPWSWDASGGRCQLHGGQSPWAHDRYATEGVTEEITVRLEHERWSGAYALEAYSDTGA